ncbi:GGDEF domain-containing protein, partial [Acinetobacter baumannii]|uniref:GGDEF domain-containing protein n=1 Tax=Acinetobacter baumannii TaxID=470 RepID=UPI00144A828F
FKNVNDSLGHVAGDELLRKAADRLRTALRESDTLARVGGDEFVLLGEVDGPPGVSVIARKIIDTIAEPFDISGSRLYISTSVGVTLYPRDAAEPALLLRNADLALYRAKREGRGRYQFYSPDMDLELSATRNLENGLRRALKE